MTRPRRRHVVLVVAVALGATAARTAWLAFHPRPAARAALLPPALAEPGGAAERDGATRLVAVDPVAPAFRVRELAAEPARSERPVERPRPVAATPAFAGQVLVRGRVLRAGRPVADCDLSFSPAGVPGDEHDWDYTDRRGRYEVLLPAGRYVVRADEGGPGLAEVDVLRGRRALVADIELPQRGPARR